MARSVVVLCALGAILAFGAATRAEHAKPAGGDAAFKDKVEFCSACHGPGGVSQIESVPSLAGEPDIFTEYQLVYFRSETRKNEQMTPAAQDLTDDEIRKLGAYFASLPGPPAPTGPDPDPALTKAGAALAKDRHCAQCHLDTFVGQGEIARLAGQREEVIVKAFHDYQHGARRGRGNVIMPEIAYSLDEDDIKALAHFMSRQSGAAGKAAEQ
jgi:cytochrome c553